MKKPKIENDKSLKKFMHSAGITDTLLLHLDSTSSYAFRKEIFDVVNLPSVEFYNNNGDLLRRLNNDECPYRVVDQFSIMDIDTLKVLAKNRLNDILNKFETKDKVHLRLNELNNGNAIVVIYYIKAFRKHSRKALSLWTEKIKSNKRYDNIMFLYCNMDMHASWGIKSRQDDRYLIFDY